MKPLEGITVLEFCQFMAGPSAGLKLADLGARVIKIERPGSGEAGRQIAIKNIFIEGDSLVFHTVNRNKESFAANLKDPEDLAIVKKLIAQADVMTHNFRPGVMEKIGLDYATVQEINPKLVYGVVTGYGAEGPWAKKPGQDLLVQSLSGLSYLSGNKDSNPTPVGLAVSDIMTGVHLGQGILAALVRRGKTGKGGLVEVSLLESTLDLQFEGLTTYLNDDCKAPVRAKKGSAQPYLAAPYGVYPTADGHIAIAMMPVTKLADHLQVILPDAYQLEESWFEKRDEIMNFFRSIFTEQPTSIWLEMLEAKDIWCADVLNYQQLTQHKGYQELGMEQEVVTTAGEKIKTTRFPLRLDGQQYFSKKAAPRVGEHTDRIKEEFGLKINA
ncbi:CoA transferase [Persicobacter diffluens]|uniref:CoA transferase n=1 Tax=Persicobacter diffluens TaxID=981 RepID=A0AAN4W241_9BACT|nr:CoA transferase [Persicobacter diffluens]